ncbi:hypothetical protein CTI12_AA420280 [Artemisia annua]|uniref:Uncharacterized protein n=1 Tax=Artemisia annua TaxID=35608 RepID=A0A2U1LP26_ARTAN|nr:hypothetical protein CTI12_AA420280 [Artemisia annua]
MENPMLSHIYEHKNRFDQPSHEFQNRLDLATHHFQNKNKENKEMREESKLKNMGNRIFPVPLYAVWKNTAQYNLILSTTPVCDSFQLIRTPRMESLSTEYRSLQTKHKLRWTEGGPNTKLTVVTLVFKHHHPNYNLHYKVFKGCIAVQIVVEAGGMKQLTNTFPCLKTLLLDQLNLSSPDMLSCALDMIWGFQNLKTLDIIVTYKNPRPPPFFEASEVDFSRLRKLQLEFADSMVILGGTSVFNMVTVPSV